MKNLLTHNIGWKLISLVIAAVIWFAIMNIADPVVSETFTGIPVTIVNDEVITSRGYQYTVESGDKVDVICKGKRSVVYSLSASDFKAHADFNTLNSMYMAGITVECTADSAQDVILRQRTENMAVKLEDQEVEPFNVRVELIGDVREGYFCYDTQLSSSLVQVSGASSQVAEVKEVVAYVDIGDKAESFTADSELIAYDFNGEPIDSMKLSFSQNTVAVTVEIFRTKEVNIDVVTYGNPIVGYYVEKLDFAPSTVLLAADETTLMGLETLKVEYDVTGLSKDTEVQLSLADYLEKTYGNTVYAVDDQAYIGIAVKVTPFVERTIEVKENNIEVRNVSEGLEATLYAMGGQTVTIRGAENIITAITASDLKLYVDMTACVAGTYSRQLRSDYGSDITITSGAVMVRLNTKDE